LVDFTKKCLFRRQDRLEKQIRPTVHVVTAEQSPAHEFALPGGVFISEGHVWVSVSVPGLVWVGIDDFARKMIGRIDAVEFPSKGSQVRKGERVFAIRQGERTVSFRTPISGRIHAVNAELAQNLAWLEKRPYEKGWICSIKPDQLALELESLRIGERAADWYQQEIKRARELLTPARSNDQGRYPAGPPTTAQLVEGQLQEVDEQTWDHFTRGFFSV
jgi:glycine cleavage system H protein